VNKINLNDIQWISVKIEGDEKSHKLKNLKNGYAYLIRIRAKNKSGWGMWSDVAYFMTKNLVMVWDRRHHGPHVQFISDDRIRFGRYQSKAVVDYVIKESHTRKFVWEFVVHSLSNYTWIGFVKSPAKSTVYNWNTFLGGNNYGEYSIGFGHHSTTLTVQNGYGNYGYNYNYATTVSTRRGVRQNDKFKFKVNFKDHTVTVYHNHHCLGEIFRNIPDAIVPAASNSSSSSEITVRCIH